MVHGNWRLKVVQLNLLFGVVSFSALLPIVPVYQFHSQSTVRYSVDGKSRVQVRKMRRLRRKNKTHPPLLLIPFTTPPP
jgi:hypothetical protein